MYIVMEIQTNTDGTIGTLIDSYTERNEAESKYHTILASASISALPMHSACMFTNDGRMMKSEVYEHPIEPEEETPTEEDSEENPE